MLLLTKATVLASESSTCLFMTRATWWSQLGSPFHLFICSSSETQKGDKWPHKSSPPQGRDSTGLPPHLTCRELECSVDGFYRLWGSCFTTVTILELVWGQGCVLQADEGGKARESISYMYPSVSGLDVCRALCSDLLLLISESCFASRKIILNDANCSLCFRNWVWKGRQKYICTHFYRKTVKTSISKPLSEPVWIAS